MEKPVTIWTFDKLLEAESFKVRLEVNGIESRIVDGEIVNMYWIISFAVGGIKLKVDKRDYERAMEILSRDYSDPDLDIGPEIGPESPYCFRCHSREIKVRVLSRAERFLIPRRLGIPIPLKLKAFLCRNCGKFWTRG